ncbi:MAG: HlyC/CorC family transporter [Clostridia bacterium]|jgi:putative hemolysin|nr:HlyC/CorC family transporter [Clostridia bacterium]MBT7123138.1 HlyC/CorC family transporter [Clostridia bacterium]
MTNTIWLPLVVQLILISINAVFACTEIAVLSINEEKYKRAAAAGDKRAHYLVLLLAQPARFLATIQVGITLAGFLASAFAAQSFSGPLVAWLQSIGVTMAASTLDTLVVIVITLILSYFTLVFGELVPKRIAMQRAEKIARRFGHTVYIISKIFTPIVWLLTISTNAVLRLLRINPHDNEKEVTEEEIRILVDLGEQKGAIAPEEGEMIDNVLELSDTPIGQIMTPRTSLILLQQQGNRDAWLNTICDSEFSRYPVCKSDIDDVVGILHVRDLLCTKSTDTVPLHKTHFVPETTNADIVLREMLKTKSHMYMVVDEYGSVIGAVTLEDILEEIVGEIEDEHDDESPFITLLSPGVWRVRGDTDIDELNAAIGVPLPLGDYDTLGGLVFSRLNYVPKDNTTPEITVAGMRIKVTQITDRRIVWAEVSLLPKAKEA